MTECFRDRCLGRAAFAVPSTAMLLTSAVIQEQHPGVVAKPLSMFWHSLAWLMCSGLVLGVLSW